MKIDDLRFEYGHAVRQRAILDGAVAPVIDEKEAEKVLPPSPGDSFLSIVYAINPLTRLPTGDLSYMVSDNVNPEVKQWVLSNLLFDVSAAAVPAAPNGLSDDDIIALSRDPKEDINSYMERVNIYAKSNDEFVKRAYEQLQSSRTVQSVSFEDSSASVSSE